MRIPYSNIYIATSDASYINGSSTVEQFCSKYGISKYNTAELGARVKKISDDLGFETIRTSRGKVYHPEHLLLRVSQLRGWIGKSNLPDPRIRLANKHSVPPEGLKHPIKYYLKVAIWAIKEQNASIDLIQNMLLRILSKYAYLYPNVPKLVELKWEKDRFQWICPELEIHLTECLLTGSVVKKTTDNGSYTFYELGDEDLLLSKAMKEQIRALQKSADNYPFYETYRVFVSNHTPHRFYI